MSWAAPATYTERAEGTADSGGVVATKTLTSGSATTSLAFVWTGIDLWERIGFTVQITEGSTPQTITCTGIASEEAVGTPKLNLTIQPAAVASGEAFGDLVITTPDPQSIVPTGILSGEAFGTLRTGLFVGPSSIASGEAFGSPRLAALIGPVGIASGEAFGTPNLAIEQFVLPAGIGSAETFGTLTLQLGYPQTVIPVGIESAEVVEDLALSNLHHLILTNPSIQETPAAWDRLNVRFGLHRGITIMKSGGVYRQVRYPAQTEIEAAERTYMGGHKHIITSAEAEELINAGYGEYISLDLV